MILNYNKIALLLENKTKENSFRQIYICKENWKSFLDVAFKNSDYFSLTLYSVNTSIAASCEYMLESLKPCLMEKQIRVWGEYDIFFYNCNFFSQKVLYEIGGIEMLGNNRYLEDLCFYKDEKMWFKNISHERVCFIDQREENIVYKLKKAGISLI